MSSEEKDTAQQAAKTLDPFTLVVFGASGDLTTRKLIPAMFSLFCQDMLDKDSSFLGFARTEMTDKSFRERLRATVRESLTCRGEAVDEQTWADFASRLHYQQGSYDSPADFQALARRIRDLSAGGKAPGNCLYYLATPPAAFPLVVEQLGRAGMSAGTADGEPWTRIIVEKPFGRDLAGARELNERLRSVFDERQILRIDHYLGKETVQNIMVLRFANSIFEHLWSHDYIDHVQITVAESLGVGARGGYYDNAGALRDMVQSHMMNLLCLVAMEPPVALAPDAVRSEKVKVLESLRPIPPECAANGVVRAQYAAGTIDGEDVPAYRQAAGVAPDSRTETFVAFKVHVDNWRWADVPFYLRTGKCLPRRCTEISVHFKAVPNVLFNLPPTGPLQPNVLTIRIQPDEGMSLAFQVKSPGLGMRIAPLKMDFGYAEAFGSAPRDAYERLLLDAAVGEATLFTRADEVEAAWRFLSPIIEGCSRCPDRLPEYPAGTWGPKQADDLVGSDGRQWHLR